MGVIKINFRTNLSGKIAPLHKNIQDLQTLLQLCHIIICQIKQLSLWKFKDINTKNVDSIKADFEEILKKVYTYTEHISSLKSRGKSERLFFAQFGSSDDWPCARVSSCDSWMLLAGPTTSSLPFKMQQSTVSTLNRWLSHKVHHWATIL